MSFLKRFLNDDRGVSFIEFNMILALVVISWMSATATLGTKASEMLEGQGVSHHSSAPVVNISYNLNRCSTAGIDINAGGTIGNFYNKSGISIGYYGNVPAYNGGDCASLAKAIQASDPERYQFYNGSNSFLKLPEETKTPKAIGPMIPPGDYAILFLQDGLQWDGVSNPIWAVYPSEPTRMNFVPPAFLVRSCLSSRGVIIYGEKIRGDMVCQALSGSAPVYSPKILIPLIGP